MDTGHASPESAASLLGQAISLHGPDDCAFLLDKRDGKVYATNASGAFLWRRLSGGMSPSAAADDLAHATGLPVDVARRHLSLLLDQWAGLGQTGGGRADADPSPPERPRCPAPQMAPPIAAAVERRYGLLDTVFLVRFFGDSIAAETDDVLPAATNRSARPDCKVDVFADGDRIAIAGDGSVLDQCASVAEVVPTLKARLLQIALERDAPHGVLHAAALAKDDGTLLLPAPTGFGKSTLAAGLARSGGWRLVADDLVPLGRAGASVRALPTAVCLKEGAWPLLRSLAPDLNEQPIFVRQDGKHVRYLQPETEARNRSAESVPPVRWIVFPSHAPDATPRLVRLPSQAGVARLLTQFFSRSGKLEPLHLDRIIALAGRASCYDLEVGTLDQGIALIRELTG